MEGDSELTPLVVFLVFGAEGESQAVGVFANLETTMNATVPLGLLLSHVLLGVAMNESSDGFDVFAIETERSATLPIHEWSVRTNGAVRDGWQVDLLGAWTRLTSRDDHPVS